MKYVYKMMIDMIFNNEFFCIKEIRVIVRKIEKSFRDILMILQNIHNENSMEENISN